MKELELIAAEVDRLRAAGKSAVLATVVSVEGSGYRLPGARMLITDGRWIAGSVSGGCLESDVVLRSQDVIRKGEASVVTYDTTGDEDILFGVGLGCRGIVKVLIEPITPQRADPDLVSFIKACLERREAGVVATVVHCEGDLATGAGRRLLRGGDGRIAGDIGDDTLRSALEAYLRRTDASAPSTLTTFNFPEGRAELFVEVIRPPLPLVIFGAGHDAIPLARFAKDLGWHVTVVDHREAYAAAERFPGVNRRIVCTPENVASRVPLGVDTVALVMTHNYLRDLQLLKTLLPSAVRYVGLLGPRRRAEQLLDELAQQAVKLSAAQRERLYAPVGLDIGAEGPEGVALSILAEIHAVLAGRAPSHLRERKKSIHGLDAPAGVRPGRRSSTKTAARRQVKPAARRPVKTAARAQTKTTARRRRA